MEVFSSGKISHILQAVQGIEVMGIIRAGDNEIPEIPSSITISFVCVGLVLEFRNTRMEVRNRGLVGLVELGI